MTKRKASRKDRSSRSEVIDLFDEGHGLTRRAISKKVGIGYSDVCKILTAKYGTHYKTKAKMAARAEEAEDIKDALSNPVVTMSKGKASPATAMTSSTPLFDGKALDKHMEDANKDEVAVPASDLFPVVAEIREDQIQDLSFVPAKGHLLVVAWMDPSEVPRFIETVLSTKTNKETENVS